MDPCSKNTNKWKDTSDEDIIPSSKAAVIGEHRVIPKSCLVFLKVWCLLVYRFAASVEKGSSSICLRKRAKLWSADHISIQTYAVDEDGISTSRGSVQPFFIDLL